MTIYIDWEQETVLTEREIPVKIANMVADKDAFDDWFIQNYYAWDLLEASDLLRKSIRDNWQDYCKQRVLSSCEAIELNTEGA